jgi:hypothetical protein
MYMQGTTRVAALVAGAMCLSPVFAQTSVSVSIVEPSPNTLVGDSLYVVAEASGTYELQTVQADLEGLQAGLVFTTAAYSDPLSEPGWTHTFSLAGLAQGSNTLTVTATDLFGNTAQAQCTIIYHLPPTLTVTEPVNGVVARPRLHIDVSSADADPAGCVLKVRPVYFDNVGLGPSRGPHFARVHSEKAAQNA